MSRARDKKREQRIVDAQLGALPEAMQRRVHELESQVRGLTVTLTNALSDLGYAREDVRVANAHVAELRLKLRAAQIARPPPAAAPAVAGLDADAWRLLMTLVHPDVHVGARRDRATRAMVLLNTVLRPPVSEPG